MSFMRFYPELLNNLTSKELTEANLANMLPVALTGAVIALIIVFAIGLYVYNALAWMFIAKKLKYKKHWLAWIPIANLFLLPILAKKKWTWGFMFLVPIANIVFAIIWMWKIFERRKLPGWFSLAILIPQAGGILYLISIGFGAWYKK